MEKFIVKETQNNMRLDKVLVAFMSDKSRNYISKLIDDGNCFVNDKPAKASLKVKPGDVISIDVPEDKPLDVKGEDIPLNIIYEDEEKRLQDEIQKLINEYNQKVEDMYKEKEDELMKI